MTTERSGLDAGRKWLINAALLLVCANAFAANDRVCDRVASGASIKSLDVPMPPLTIDAVDHYTADTAEIDVQATDLSLPDVESIPPLLSLAPRVASIADRVFSTDPARQAVNDDETVPAEPPLAERGLAPARLTSPVTDTESESQADPEVAVPHLREQMYRKDI